MNINFIYTNRLCLCNWNFIADGYHCAVWCTFRCHGHLAHGRGVTGSLWTALYSCIPDSIRTCRGMYMTNLYKVSSLHLSKSSSTGQNTLSCCHRASSVITEGPLILMQKHQHCQELGFIFNSVQKKICSLDNLDINVAENSHLTREYLIYFQFPSIWCFLCVPQTAKK